MSIPAIVDEFEPPEGSDATPEYVAFRKCYKELVTVFSAQPGNFCDTLFADGFIPEFIRNFTRNRSILDEEKAEKLVDTVIDRIKHDPSLFHQFMKILRSPSTEDISSKLKHYYKFECESLRQYQCSEEVSGSESCPSSTACSSPGFICPYCKQCTVDQFFSEKGCPKKKKSSLFPYLNMPTLSENERANVQMKLSSDTRQIITKFSNFSVSIRDSLGKRKELLEEIIDTVLSLEAFAEGIGVKVLESEDQKEIQAATSVARVFIVLRSYMSFFNYEIIEHLIQHHGSAEDHKRLEEYLHAFNVFCQRSIFEVPPSVFQNSLRSSGKIFAFKCTEPSRIARLEDVLVVKEKIAKIFGLQPLALHLCWIKKGCVELHLLVSAAVSDHISPVPECQLTALAEIGVKVLFPSEERTENEEDENTGEKGASSKSYVQDTLPISPSSSSSLTLGQCPDSLPRKVEEQQVPECIENLLATAKALLHTAKKSVSTVEQYRTGSVDIEEVNRSFKNLSEILEKSGCTLRENLSKSISLSANSLEEPQDSSIYSYAYVPMATRPPVEESTQDSPDLLKRQVKRPVPLPRSRCQSLHIPRTQSREAGDSGEKRKGSYENVVAMPKKLNLLKRLDRPIALPRTRCQSLPTTQRSKTTTSLPNAFDSSQQLKAATKDVDDEFTDDTGDSGLGSGESDRLAWIKNSRFKHKKDAFKMAVSNKPGRYTPLLAQNKPHNDYTQVQQTVTRINKEGLIAKLQETVQKE